MGLLDFITGGGNDYVGQNFPIDMAPAADGGSDPMAMLKDLLTRAAAPADLAPPQQPATDFSSMNRAPEAVPLPQPRPNPGPPYQSAYTHGNPFAQPTIDDTMTGALNTAPSAPLSLAPPQQPMTPGTLPSKGDNFGLLSMIAPEFTKNNAPAIGKAFASLGGGLSSVTGNTAGGAFARGMGGSLKSGTSYDKDTADRALKELKAMQEARAAGDNAKYKAALTNYYNVLTQAKETAAAAGNAGGTPTRRQTQWDDPRFRFDKFRTAAAASDKAIDNEFVNDPRARRFSTPDEKKALKAEIVKRKQDARSELRQRYEVGSDDAPPANGGKEQNPGEISFKGNGTQGAPYQPATKADYDEIPSGAYYVHPTRGLVIKG